MKTARTLGVAALALAAAACDERAPAGPQEVRVHAASPARFDPPVGFTKLRLSSTPHLDPAGLEKAMAPLADYLSRGLNVPVEVTVATSYDELGQRLARNEVDLAQFTPYSYVRARKTTSLQPIAAVIADGSASAAGYIVVKADSSVQRLEDLKGRSFGFVDPASTSGYLYPLKLMRDRGIDPATFFSRTEFLGHHDAALLAVYEGRVDATASYQGALVALWKSQRIDPLSFRIIAKTPRTPRDIYCAREGLPAEVVRQVRALLLGLSVRTAEGRATLHPLDFNGFVPVDERAYDAVREVQALLADGGSP